MTRTRHVLLMTTAAAVCAMPLLAFGQANTGGSSQMQTTTQTTPNQGQVSSTPAARDAATTGREFPPGGAAQSQATGSDARPGAASRTDGTPGNPPSTATQRAADAVTGQRTDPDGTGNNPPGTAAGRAIDRATGGTATGATGTTGTMAVDSARLRDGRRASKVIGATVYNENNDNIGEVDDLIVPPGGGQPVAVLSVGGFLGIGARLVAIPYERLQYNAERERWTLQGATKDSLQALPAYDYDDGNRRG